MKRNKRKNKGFTLIEVMIVLAIIGVIFSFVGVNVIKKYGESKVQAAKIQIASYEQSLQSYYLGNSFFPHTSQGLQALVQKPSVGRVPKNWTGGYFNKKELVPDPWGEPYGYACDDYQNYIITSSGPDGQDGTDDDISSDSL